MKLSILDEERRDWPALHLETDDGIHVVGELVVTIRPGGPRVMGAIVNAFCETLNLMFRTAENRRRNIPEIGAMMQSRSGLVAGSGVVTFMDCDARTLRFDDSPKLFSWDDVEYLP